jgi:hypothetical protein
MRRVPIALILSLCGSLAHAGLIIQTRSYEITTPFVAGGSASNIGAGFAYFDAFDPALGVLSQVDISITGSVLVDAALPLSQTCTLGCVPAPYFADLTVEHDFGLGSLLNHQVRYVGQASGQPGQFASLTTYTQSTSLTEITDLAGIAGLTTGGTPGLPIPGLTMALIPPIASTLARDDFVDPNAIPLFFLHPVQSYDFVGGIGVGGPIAGTITSAGQISVTYLFEEPPPAVPEPGALSLFGASLVAFGIRRNRRFLRKIPRLQRPSS